MRLTHNCSTGRKDVAIIKEDNGVINIKYSESEGLGNIVGNITFCPFCGVNLKQAQQ